MRSTWVSSVACGSARAATGGAFATHARATQRAPAGHSAALSQARGAGASDEQAASAIATAKVPLREGLGIERSLLLHVRAGRW